jgi:mannose-6-phosphate isomerase-like protein (cupin superfamily)
MEASTGVLVVSGQAHWIWSGFPLFMRSIRRVGNSMSMNEFERSPVGRLKRRVANWGVSRRLRAFLVDQRSPIRDPSDRAADRVPTVFGYRKPPARDQGKEVVRLCKTPTLRAKVQIVREGAPENLHAHEGVDGFWMVLRGRARFFGRGNVTLGELGPHEGILIPRTIQYGYESMAAEDLELLQVLALDRRGPVSRRDHAPKEYDRGEVLFFDARRPSECDGQVAAVEGA